MKCKIGMIRLFSVLLFLSATLVFGAAADAAPEKCPSKVKVLVKEMSAGTFHEYQALEKRLLPAMDTDVKASVAGVIKTIDKKVGSKVVEGDIILRLDTEKAEKEIAAAKADAKIWKKKLRQRKNWKVRSERAEKQAESKLKEATEKVEKARQLIANATVKAPASGTIGTLNANEGDHVSDGYVVGNVVDTTVMKISLGQYLPNVKNKQGIKINIKELSQSVTGVVKKEDDTIGALYLKNPDGKLLIGMTAQFNVLLKMHPNTVSLAKQHIMKDESGHFVYTLNDKRAAKTALKPGPIDLENNVLIKDGLKAGDFVIVAEILSAKEGTLKKAITCLEDNKKIKVMVKSEESGKFVKWKAPKKAKTTVEKKEKPAKVKPVKKEEPKKIKKKKIKKKKPVRKTTASASQSKIRVGVNASYYKMTDSNFEDVYGRMTSFGLDIAYFLTPKIDIWFSGAFGSKSATLDDFPEADLKFKFTPLSLDARYYFVRNSKFDFLAGAGISYYSFEETQSLGFEGIKDNAIGFNLLAGTYYHLTEKLSLQLLFRLNMVKKTIEIEDVDNDLNLNSMELLFGISYGF